MPENPKVLNVNGDCLENNLLFPDTQSLVDGYLCRFVLILFFAVGQCIMYSMFVLSLSNREVQIMSVNSTLLIIKI